MYPSRRKQKIQKRQVAIKSHNTCRLQMLQDEMEENTQTLKEAKNLTNSVV